MDRLALRLGGRRHEVHVWAPAAARTPPVLALHGFGTTGLRTYRYLAPSLGAAGVPLYAPDLAGFGASDAADGVHGLRAYARDVVALADALGLDRPVLAGHSLGGKIAAAAAALHPDRFGGLVLVAPGGFTRLARLTPALAAMADALRLFERPWFYEHVVPRTPLASVLPDAASRAALRRMQGAHAALDLDRAGLRARLREIDVPTLVVWGARDPVLPPRTARRVLRDLPHARLVVVPEAGHAPMKDRPAAVAEALVSFLQ